MLKLGLAKANSSRHRWDEVWRVELDEGHGGGGDGGYRISLSQKMKGCLQILKNPEISHGYWIPKNYIRLLPCFNRVTFPNHHF